MSFDTPAGTRGARTPKSAGPVTKFVQRLMFKQHRRKGTFQGMDILLLTTVGKRSGQRRESALSWFPDGDDARLIVASAAGAAHNPAWYHNLAAHPDQVWIELPAEQRKVKVTAEQLDGERRAEAWKRITEAQPRYAKYQEKTDRQLPVIRLVEDTSADEAS